jgi:hypothetical protein
VPSTTWASRANAAMRQLIEDGDPFTADDLVAITGWPDDRHASNGQNSAVGSMFQHYKRRGMIEACGVAQSKAPQRKGGMVRVWRPRWTQLTLFDGHTG